MSQDAAAGADAGAGASIQTLRKRAQFLAAARARKQVAESMVVQARDRRDGTRHVGVGVTCSRKVGNAVTRNRAKRRLRALAHEVLPLAGHPGWDYVLIGRPGVTVERPYGALRDDLRKSLARLHAPRRPKAQQ
ncbi:MAG: ribonuclease P protein component [Rhodobacteraceae bacterium HLUCCA24]|nr:MAG: ribonuclease P protein component [Rhodobacteraceae bacterium HLUCCA24]